MKSGIRICGGIILRSKEMKKLEITITKVNANPMPKALLTVVVTAKAGQNPSSKPKVGHNFINFFKYLPQTCKF